MVKGDTKNKFIEKGSFGFAFFKNKKINIKFMKKKI
jgi:hypothetical protein